ncbi:MAG: hypothetical protein WD648_12150 [Planctomycetaceae bacterium]
MNFALLGDDAAVSPLIAAIAANPEHRLSHAALTGAMTPEWLTVSPSTTVAADWDELIGAREVDAVIVAGADPEILEAVRQIASAGKPLVVFPRAGQGTTWVYELSLIRDDNGVALVPVFVARFDRKLDRLRRLIDDGTIGKVLQFHIERELRVTSATAGTPLLPVAEVEDAFLPDVDVLRFLGGNYSRVTSFFSGTVNSHVSQATNTLSGDGLPEALWSLKGTAGNSRWQLSVVGDAGKLILSGESDSPDWRLSIDGVEEPDDAAREYRDTGEAILVHVERALAGEPIRPDWTDLTRALEICDGARRSLRRRRTIDLHFESTSERSQFKTQMTAIGCSLLFLTLFGVVFVLIGGTVFDPRETAEIKAEHAGAILYDDDFVPGSAELIETAQNRLNEIARRMPGSTFPVIVEQSADERGAALDEARRLAVVGQLKAAGAPDAEQRTIVARLRGRGFQACMQVARLAVFVPLGLFLLLQLLLFITRAPAEAGQPTSTLDG